MKKPLLTRLALACVVLGAISFWGFQQMRSPSSGTSEMLRQAPAQEILTHIQSLNSPLVILNIWATWCEPCVAEMPIFLAAHKKFAEKGVKLVLLSIDGADARVDAEIFLKRLNVDFQTFYKGDQSINFVQEFLPNWGGAVPATILFGQDLKILDSWEGETSEQELSERIEKQLKRSPL